MEVQYMSYLSNTAEEELQWQPGLNGLNHPGFNRLVKTG